MAGIPAGLGDLALWKNRSMAGDAVDDEWEAVPDEIAKPVFAGLIAIPLISALISYWLPVSFAVVAIPLIGVWLLVLKDPVAHYARAVWQRLHQPAEERVPVREGFRPVDWRWVAKGAVVALVAVPLLLIVLFL